MLAVVIPLIADFLSEDRDLLKRMKARITEEEWAMVGRKAKMLVTARGWLVRSANPLLVVEAGRPLESTPPEAFDRPLVRRQASAPAKRERQGTGIPSWVWIVGLIVVFALMRAAMRH